MNLNYDAKILNFLRLLPIVTFYWLLKKNEYLGTRFNGIKSITIYSFENPFDSKNILSSSSDQHVLKTIKDAELQDLFKNVFYKRKKPLWKTAIPATIDYVNGDKLFITISSYGSFFVVAGQDGYFYFKGDAFMKKWNALIFEKTQ